MRIIMQANVVVPTRMRYLLTYIDMCQRIMSSSKVRQPHSGYKNLSAKNRMYYILEAFEAEYVHFFLSEVLKFHTPVSVVLRHDGLYMSPAPSQTLLDAAASNACTRFRMPLVTMKVTSLISARAAVIEELKGLQGASVNADASIFAHINARDWWDNLHVPPPKLPTRANTQALRVSKNDFPLAEDPNTIRRFLVRCKVA